MASVCNDPGGTRRILFIGPDGTRKTIRLGKVPQRDAEAVARHIEALLASKIAGTPVPRPTATWLGGIGEPLRSRLARAGLVEAAPSAPTLQAFLNDYLAGRNDVGPATRIILQQAARHLVAVLGAETRLDAVTPADAERFKTWLVSRGCSRSAVAKWVRYARHVFAVAVHRKLLAESPFAHVKGGQVVGDPARRKFIPAEEVLRVL